MEKSEILKALEVHNITLESVFVPFSQSRNKGKKDPSLNWKVTLKKDGREIITTDYMAGCGHAPAFKSKRVQKLPKYEQKQLIAWECENGFEAFYMENISHIMRKNQTRLTPDICNVVHSLLMDSDAIDYCSFEEWAANYGYDTDSRSAKDIFDACLMIGLKLRNGLGESTMKELREAFQDY